MNKIITVFICVFLISCGSDSTDSNETGSLTFISNSEFQVTEGGTTEISILMSNSDNQNLSIIKSGPDEAYFEVDEDGVLRFSQTADFENPSDSDNDNVYDVTILVTDVLSTSTSSKDFSFVVNNANEAPVSSTVAVIANAHELQQIELRGTDQESATLSYKVTNQPIYGVLTDSSGAVVTNQAIQGQLMYKSITMKRNNFL